MATSLKLSTLENRLYHRISLTAENEERQYVRYSVHGEPRNGKIHAIFPGVGKIDVLMHPTRLKERPPPKGCKLPKAVIQYGTFVGTIELRGNGIGIHTARHHQRPRSDRTIKAPGMSACGPGEAERYPGGPDDVRGTQAHDGPRNGECVSQRRRADRKFLRRGARRTRRYDDRSGISGRLRAWGFRSRSRTDLGERLPAPTVSG